MKIALFLVTYVFFYRCNLTVSVSSSFSTDSDVLMRLKSSVVGIGGSGLEDWNSSVSSHCFFSGVICDGNSRVVELNISFNHLNGFLPPEIGLLEKLVNLTASANNLTGKLPQEISNLTLLRVLNISNNNFYGDFPVSIAGGLPELEVLDCYNNNFSGALPIEIVNLKNLKHLHLGGNYFSGEIPERYSEIWSLEYLGLNGNSLTGSIPASLGLLTNLRELYLGYFNKYDGGIPSEFGSLTSLVRLDMGSCNLSGPIPPSLGKLKLLDTLFLQMNRLSGPIPPEFSQLVSLKSLDLSVNELYGKIPDGFAQMKQLTLLNLFNNHLLGRIPAFVSDLPDLEVLQVWGNNFTFELPRNLGQNGKLLKLDVASNRLTGTIPRGLCSGGKLQMLILMENYLFGSLPEEIGECKSLTRVRIGKNFLNGTIPAGLFNLPLVDIMELGDNFFSGEIPANVSGDSLGTLILANNQFTGKIPSSVKNLKGLQTLSLEMNRFSGEIPPEIGYLKQLSKLNLSSNEIQGKIPMQLVQCTSLYSIDLSRNNLSGEIPVQIAKLAILNTLNLSRNQFMGEVPQEMQHMRSLTSLDLSYNNLSGKIPTAGQFLVFNLTSFVGNPNLCSSSHGIHCDVSKDVNRAKQMQSSSITLSKLLILIGILSGFLLISTISVIKIRKSYKIRSSVKSWKLTSFQRLDFTIDDVLDCLKDDNIIGKGGAGIVYRGSMPGGIDIAIKRLAGRAGKSNDSGFSAEIQTLGRIRHRNIVRLLGFLSNKEANLLLYEYMPNGSLGEILHGSKGGNLLWETRYRIAVESAKGLCYLHHDCFPLIIHRDVKSNNILLDLDYEAHVADFGLAKFLRDAGTSECMSSIAGSYGYIAPEYAYTLRVDEKSDVYSYGVVLLELITGRKPVGDFGDGVDIVQWVQKTTSENSQISPEAIVRLIADRRLRNVPIQRAVNLFKIAMLCVEEHSSARPTMRDVVHLLTNSPSSPPSDLLSL